MLIEKKIDTKKSIGKVAKELGVRTHVIRFWESKFPQIKPQIGRGGRRYYFSKEVDILKRIKSFLYDEGYTISGLQKLLKQRQNKRERSEVQKEQDLQFLLFEDEHHKVSNQQDSTNNQDNKKIAELVNNIEVNLEKFKTFLNNK